MLNLLRIPKASPAPIAPVGRTPTDQRPTPLRLFHPSIIMPTRELRARLIGTRKPRRHVAPFADVVRHIDQFGRSIVGVAIAGASLRVGKTVRVWMLEDDYVLLRRAYADRAWTINTNAKGGMPYVRVCMAPFPSMPKTLARYLLGSPKGGLVRYRDGNVLNLLRDNLVLTVTKAAEGE